nr:short-chain [Pseudonaja textilis]
MKTLLLTLVVVTIVCLDLGYTLICHDSENLDDHVVCKEDETMCYQYTFVPFRDFEVVARGCSPSCPEEEDAVCCSTDLCNK